MKLREKIYKPEIEGLFDCDIYYDHVVTKGLYLAVTSSYIKKNVKALSIDYQVPDDVTMMGVKYSKQNEFVAITLGIFDDHKQPHKFQFIIKESCTPDHIYSCRHGLIEGLKEVLIDGLKMLYATTLNDVADWVDDQKNN
jgi:hypothetical protein